MTIVKNNSSLKESLVYRSLVRQAVKDNLIKDTEEQIVKNACEKASNELKPSGNFDVDIALLVSALKEKGLTKQAIKIQENYLEYKKAENSLYNFKNENLMEFSHQDGDVEIAPAENDLGKVETAQSAAKKILDIVNKEPTGKVASLKKKAQTDPIAETEARVQKAFDDIEAVKNSLDLNLDNINFNNLNNKNIAQLYSEVSGTPLNDINKYVVARQFLNNIVGNKFSNKNETLKAIAQSIKNGNQNVFQLAKVLGFDPSSYGPLNENVAIKYLKNTFDPLRVSELLNIVPNEVDKNVNKLSNDIYNGIYASFVSVLGENRNKFDDINNRIKNSYNNVKKALKDIDIPKASEFVNYAQVNYDYIIKFINSLYNKMNEISNSDDSKFLDRVLEVLSPNDFQKLSSFVENLKKVLDRAISTIPPEGSVMRKAVPDFVSKLRPAIEFWQKKYNQFTEGSEDKKNAGLNLATLIRLQKGIEPFVGSPFINLRVVLPRIEQTLPKELPPQPLSQIDSVEKLDQYLNVLLSESQEKRASINGIIKQAGFLLPTSDTNKGQPQGAGRPASTTQPSGTVKEGRPTDAEKKEVITMQRLLGKFAQGLTEKPEEAAKKTNSSVEQIRSLASTIGFTGKSGSEGEGAHDGKWGPNTIKALQAAMALAEKLGKKGELTDGGVTYLQKDPKEVERDARKNVEGLISVMKEADLSPYLGEYNIELDYIPRYKSGWTSENEDPLNFNNPQEGFVVMPEHIKSIRDFFSLISSVNQSPKLASHEVAKIAQEIKDSTIVKENPYITRENPYGEGSTPPAGSMSYNDFVNALKWFYNRSNLVYRTALSRQRAGEPNPLTGKPYTNREIAIARSYHEQMQRLVSEWKQKYNNFFKEKGYVHQDDFIRAERGDFSSNKPQGAGRPADVRQTSERTSGGYSVGVGGNGSENPLKNPPLTDFINIFNLIDNYSVNKEDAQWFVDNVKTGVMDRKEWRRNYVDEIVNKYSKQPKRKIEYFGFLEQFRKHASNIINDVFNDWEASIEDYLDDNRSQRLYRMQNRERNRWLEIIASKVEEARRLMRA